jgi:hypothetical protein
VPSPATGKTALRIGLMLAPALSSERGFGNADCAQTCLGIAEV